MAFICYLASIGFGDMFAHHAFLKLKDDCVIACETYHILNDSLQRTLLNKIEAELGACQITTDTYFKWQNNHWAFYYFFNEEVYNIRIYFTELKYDQAYDKQPLRNYSNY
jgi:hypothetical protein